MATQAQIDSTYNYMDKVWRLNLGPHADISGAMYNGDFSLTLEQAQRNKHDYILTHTGFKPGNRILDIGCGWGAFLNGVRERGGRGVGVTLSTKQAEHCRRTGLEVYLQDWKEIVPEKLGPFDAIASMGAFEHFCSDDEFIAGKQDEIYGRYFKLCHALLPDKGRMFLQTMTFDRYVPDPAKVTVDAPDGSDERVMALVRKFYPGSWLPAGMDHIERTAEPYFKVVSSNSGREDYVKTIDDWNVRLGRMSIRKVLAMLEASIYYLRDPDFGYKLEAGRRNCNQECFKRRLMNHFRIILEKK